MDDIINKKTSQAVSISVNFSISLLVLSIGVIGANSLSLGPIASEIAIDLGGSIVQTMYAATAYGAATAASALLLTRFIDVYGSKVVLTIAMAVLAVAFVSTVFVTNVFSLILAQGLAGIGAGVALPAIYTFAAEIAPKGKESQVLGRVLIGWTLGMVGGVPLATFITDSFDWRIVFALFAALSFAIVVLLKILRFGRQPKTTEKTIFPIQAVGIPGVPTLLIICLMFMVSFYGTYSFLGGHMTLELGLNVNSAGIIAAVYGAGFGFAVIGDKFVETIGIRRAMPFVFFGISIIYFAISLGSNNYVFLIGIAFFWGFCNHFGLNLILANLVSIDPSKRGAILGINSSVTYFAAGIGALFFGPVFELYGFSTIALVASMLVAGCCLLSIFGMRAKK